MRGRERQTHRAYNAGRPSKEGTSTYNTLILDAVREMHVKLDGGSNLGRRGLTGITDSFSSDLELRGR